ncbi:MAG TPA: SCO family protein [Thermoanaerobaculia bacterium]|nr:SCO family protein [Thermoanaerobaculia bacterium]
MKGFILCITLAALLVSRAATADAPVPAGAMPGPLQEVGYDQRLGEQLPLDLPFRDEAGRPVKLGDFFGHRPVVMIFAYYHCPMLCDLVIQGATGSLKALTFDAGKDFDVVVVSIDPHETPEQAKEAKRAALAHYGRTGTAAGWHFLTGGQQPILELTQTAGFRYVYDKERNEFAHAAGVMIATPDGRISRYLYGIEYAPRDVRLALVESSAGRIGSLADQVLLYCFHYDPVYGKYSAMTMNILRLSAVVTVLGLGLLIVLLKRRERVETGPVGAA